MTNEPRRYRNISLAVTNSSQDAYTCPANTTTIVREIIVPNVDGTNNADITVTLRNAAGSTIHSTLAYTISVPSDATLVVISKDSSIYLEEDMSLYLQASAAGDLAATCSYEVISE